MHISSRLLIGACAAAFVASSAAAQNTDTATTRTTARTTVQPRRIRGSGIRVTKEGSETRTGTESGIYGGTTTSSTSPCTTADCSASTSANPTNCSGANCTTNNNNVSSGVSGNNFNSSSASSCIGSYCTRADSLNNGANAGCVGTSCAGNANTNANACTSASCTRDTTSRVNGTPTSYGNCTAPDCSSVTSTTGSNLVPSNRDSMTYNGDVDMMPAPDAGLLQGMTDENILAHLAMGDSMEIRMAQRALQNTQNQRVRDFANMLIADHSKSLQQGRSVAQQAGITPQLAVGDTAGMRMMDHMNRSGNMSGNMNMSDSMHMHGGMMAYSDATFIRHNVMMHRHMLSELQSLQGVAKSDAVRNQISATIPVVQKHLSTAEQLATALNVDLSARMKMHDGTTPPPNR